MHGKNGAVTKEYLYDAFGNERSPDANDANPFRYCGEYFDVETGDIYLRARYYRPAMGRFITEDPALSGLNWYIYCSNNPVNSEDPMGLFDYNTRLSRNQNYNKDVMVLQNELVYHGFLNMDNAQWGYFGPKTERAVSQYKKAHGLDDTGLNRGVVGKYTWKSMGLIYREQEDINAGVEIVTIGKRQYFDISKAVNNAVYNAKTEFKQHAGDTEWFRSTVGDKGKWNIKQSAEVWSKTLGISQNSYNKTVLFYGRALRMDDIGNITYGYLGKASGYPNWMLTSGSMLNHIKNHGFTDFQNEQLDEQNIMIGINWYNGIDILLSW